MPSAEGLPRNPSLAKRRIGTASTSVPGRERNTDRVSSRTNMPAINIRAETIPGMMSGTTIRHRLVR